MGFPTIIQTAIGTFPPAVGFPPSFASTTPGNTIVVFYFFNNGATPTVTDNQGNTYVGVGQQIFSFGSFLSGMFVSSGIAGGSYALTVSTIGGGGTWIAMEVGGSTGLATSQPIASTASGTVNVPCGPITTTNNNSLIFFGMVSFNPIISDTNGWTVIYNGTPASTTSGALFAGTLGNPGSVINTMIRTTAGPALLNMLALGGSGPPIGGDLPIQVFLL
jgi:hypothetical protein